MSWKSRITSAFVAANYVKLDGTNQASWTPTNVVVPLLNASLLEGHSAAYFSISGHTHAHSTITGLDYASAGHTGFQAALTFPIAATLGGTGVANNVASTLTISGAFATTLTVTNITALTLPTSGYLVPSNSAGYNISDMTDTRLVRYNSTGNHLESATVTCTGGALGSITTLSMSNQLTNTLAIGNAPFVITSTTVCSNLNADLCDGQHWATNSASQLARLGLGEAAPAVTASILALTQADNTASAYGINLTHTGTGAGSAGLNITKNGVVVGTSYGIRSVVSGGGSLNVGLYATASGGTANYAIQLSAPATTTDYLIYAGGNDYWRGDGSVRATYGFKTAYFLQNDGGFQCYSGNYGVYLRGNKTDADAIYCVYIGNNNLITASATRYIVGFYADVSTTLKSRINTLGQYETLDTNCDATPRYARLAFSSTVQFNANHYLLVDLKNLDQTLGFGINNALVHKTLTPVGSGAGSTAGTLGEIVYDASFLYVCTVGGIAGTAVWKQAALSAY